MTDKAKRAKSGLEVAKEVQEKLLPAQQHEHSERARRCSMTRRGYKLK